MHCRLCPALDFEVACCILQTSKPVHIARARLLLTTHVLQVPLALSGTGKATYKELQRHNCAQRACELFACGGRDDWNVCRQDEAFALWTEEWGSLYAPGTRSRAVIEDIAGSWCALQAWWGPACRLATPCVNVELMLASCKCHFPVVPCWCLFRDTWPLLHFNALVSLAAHVSQVAPLHQGLNQGFT